MMDPNGKILLNENGKIKRSFKWTWRNIPIYAKRGNYI